MNTKRLLLHVGLILLVVTLSAGLFVPLASAQGASKRVGVVVRFDNGSEHLQIVSVPSAATAFDALKATSLSIASSDTGFGPAICSINADGCPADNCFCDPAHFWAFWTLNAAGSDWDASMVGVGGLAPAEQSVIGFSWSGFDANFNPTVKPVVHTFADLERLTVAPAPQEVPEPATLVLLGGGLASLAGFVGLRKRAKSGG